MLKPVSVVRISQQTGIDSRMSAGENRDALRMNSVAPASTGVRNSSPSAVLELLSQQQHERRDGDENAEYPPPAGMDRFMKRQQHRDRFAFAEIVLSGEISGIAPGRELGVDRRPAQHEEHVEDGGDRKADEQAAHQVGFSRRQHRRYHDGGDDHRLLRKADERSFRFERPQHAGAGQSEIAEQPENVRRKLEAGKISYRQNEGNRSEHRPENLALRPRFHQAGRVGRDRRRR